LEDMNTNGNPGAHWENRLVDSEYMSGISDSDSQLSFLTLTFFEDMGWYTSNYSMSEPYNYGRNAGCSFVSSPCSQTNWGRYWCDTAPATRCNGHRTAGGFCTYVSYSSSLPVPFQYFADPSKGGNSPWNDYCPVISGYSNRYCHDSSQTPRSQAYGETYGPNSNCFDLGNADVTDACYIRQCLKDSSGGLTLQVYINDAWVSCPPAGGDVSIDVGIFSGTITLNCPEVGFFCSAIGSSAVNFTFDPGNNIPIPTAAPTYRLPPIFPDIPIPPGLPELGDEFKKFLNDPWGLQVGSNLFYVLIALAVIIIFVVIGCCCCKDR